MTIAEQVQALQQQIALGEARLREIEAEEAQITAPAQRPFVSAAGLRPVLQAPAPLPPVQPARLAPPPAPRPALTPADFPRAVSAHSPRFAMTTSPVAEDVRQLTSAEAVRNGTYAQNRARLLQMVGGRAQLAQHGFAETGMYGVPETELPGSMHPLARRQGPQRPRPQSSIQQPHGHPTTGPMSPLLAAKLARAYERKQSGSR